jgi:hypothetical protein
MVKDGILSIEDAASGIVVITVFYKVRACHEALLNTISSLVSFL